MSNTFTLLNGESIPKTGIGTFALTDEEAYRSVLEALRLGCRHIDTAHAYMNERAVGRALRDSGVPREDAWLTSKLWPNEYGEELTVGAVDKMLARLGVGYLDLVYLHQPFGDAHGAVKALGECVRLGKVKTIGLSNFDQDEALFDAVLAGAEIKPAIMQLECHPYAQRRHWQEKLKNAGMLAECWYPLGGRGDGVRELLRDPVILGLAQAHGKSAAQVIEKWHMQSGRSIVPGSASAEHIAENLDLSGFELTGAEMARMGSLDRERRFFDMPYEDIKRMVLGLPMND